MTSFVGMSFSPDEGLCGVGDLENEGLNRDSLEPLCDEEIRWMGGGWTNSNSDEGDDRQETIHKMEEDGGDVSVLTSADTVRIGNVYKHGSNEWTVKQRGIWEKEDPRYCEDESETEGDSEWDQYAL